MNQSEIITICRMVKALCPSQLFDEFTPDGWGLVLRPYPFDDAKAAVVAIASTPLESTRSRYIETGHIIAGIHKIRRGRLEAAPIVTPPSGLDVHDHIAWLRRTQRAIADGTFVAPTVEPAADPVRLAALIADAMPKGLDATVHPENRSNEREARA